MSIMDSTLPVWKRDALLGRASKLSKSELSVLRSTGFSEVLVSQLDGWDTQLSTLGLTDLWGSMRMLVEQIAWGVSPQQAAGIAGVSKPTFRSWVTEGEAFLKGCPADMSLGEWLSRSAQDGLPPNTSARLFLCGVFAFLLGWADGLVQSRLVGVISEVALGRDETVDDQGNIVPGWRPNWQAASWLLERRYRDDSTYGPLRQQVDVQVDGQVAVLDGATLERAIATLSDRARHLEERGFTTTATPALLPPQDTDEPIADAVILEDSEN